MSFNGLGDASLAGEELHRAFDLESGGVGGVGADADENEPLLVLGDAVVDDLVAGEGKMSVEYLDGRVGSGGIGGGGGSVGDPVVDRAVGDDTEGRGRDPVPESDIFVHQVRFDLLLELDVEDLELPGGCGRMMSEGLGCVGESTDL